MSTTIAGSSRCICGCWMFQCRLSMGPALTKIRLLSATHIEPTPQNKGDQDASKSREEQSGSTESRFACRMDRDTQGVPDQRERVHAAARRAQPPAARTAVGKGGKEVRLRRP